MTLTEFRSIVTAAQGKDQLAGPLRFGVIATLGPYILPDLIPTLHKRAPVMPSKSKKA